MFAVLILLVYNYNYKYKFYTEVRKCFCTCVSHFTYLYWLQVEKECRIFPCRITFWVWLSHSHSHRLKLAIKFDLYCTYKQFMHAIFSLCTAKFVRCSSNRPIGKWKGTGNELLFLLHPPPPPFTPRSVSSNTKNRWTALWLCQRHICCFFSSSFLFLLQKCVIRSHSSTSTHHLH